MPRALPLALLGAAMVAAAIVLLYESRGQVVRGDELGYAARLASEPFGDAVFESPPNKYFIAFPLLVYDAMFGVFGLAADVPFRVVVTALVLLCAGLFFVLARRRVGAALALPATVLLLFFGSGWETLITAIRIPSLIALASGLGSLIALERRDRRGDVAASALLTVSVASHPIGVSFLAAGGVLVIARPSPERYRSLWLLAIPAAVFGAWWLFLRAPTTESIVPTRPIDVVRFAVDSWISIVANVTGLAGVLGEPSFDQAVAKIAAAVVFAALVAAVATWWRRAPATFWAALVALVVLMASTRLSPGGFLRFPEEVRYLYPEGVLFLLVAMELAAIVRLRVWAALAVSAVLLLGLAYNLDQLHDGSRIAREKSLEALGDYSAYELAGGMLDQSYKPDDFAPSARQYVQAAEAYGSLAESQAALVSAPALERQRADASLAGSLGIQVKAMAGQPPVAGPPPKIVRATSGRVEQRRRCLALRPASTAGTTPSVAVPLDPDPSQQLRLKRALRGLPPTPTQTVVELAELTAPRGGLQLRAPEINKTAVLVGRFSEPPGAQLERPHRGRWGALRLPTGDLALPWRVTVASNQPVTVCGLAGSPG
jgi:hypothetical protein